jgi:hypothetical protein
VARTKIPLGGKRFSRAATGFPSHVVLVGQGRKAPSIKSELGHLKIHKQAYYIQSL